MTEYPSGRIHLLSKIKPSVDTLQQLVDAKLSDSSGAVELRVKVLSNPEITREVLLELVINQAQAINRQKGELRQREPYDSSFVSRC